MSILLYGSNPEQVNDVQIKRIQAIAPDMELLITEDQAEIEAALSEIEVLDLGGGWPINYTEDEVPPLEDQRAQPRPGEVGTVDEAVVAAADDDRVVALWHVLLARRASPCPTAGTPTRPRRHVASPDYPAMLPARHDCASATLAQRIARPQRHAAPGRGLPATLAVSRDAWRSAAKPGQDYDVGMGVSRSSDLVRTCPADACRPYRLR